MPSNRCAGVLCGNLWPPHKRSETKDNGEAWCEIHKAGQGKNQDSTPPQSEGEKTKIKSEDSEAETTRNAAKRSAKFVSGTNERIRNLLHTPQNMSEELNHGMRLEARRQGIDVLESYWEGRDAVTPYTPPTMPSLPAPTPGQQLNQVVSDLALPVVKLSGLAALVSMILGFGTAAAASAATFVSANTGAVLGGIACVAGLLLLAFGRGGKVDGAAGPGVSQSASGSAANITVIINAANGEVVTNK